MSLCQTGAWVQFCSSYVFLRRPGCKQCYLGHTLPVAGPWGWKVKPTRTHVCEDSAYVMPPKIPLAKAGLMAKPNITRAKKFTLTAMKRRGRMNFFLKSKSNYYMYSTVYPIELRLKLKFFNWRWNWSVSRYNIDSMGHNINLHQGKTNWNHTEKPPYTGQGG